MEVPTVDLKRSLEMGRAGKDWEGLGRVSVIERDESALDRNDISTVPMSVVQCPCSAS